jgi:hypothetical protein
MSETQTTGSSAPARDGPEGIGGWLVLPVIGLVLTPLRGLYQLSQLTGVKDSLQFLSSGQTAFLVVETLLSLVIAVGLPIALIVLLFNKKKAFPRLYVIWAVLCLAFLIVDLILAQALFKDIFAASGVELIDADTLKDILRTLVLVGVWVPYMLNARRVRNTFVQ